MSRYDVIVAGLGGMGSAALAHCAMLGARTLGLEQFWPAHALSASSGKTRIIRKAYFENPAYVPLLHRAYELWSELERRTDSKILYLIGLLNVGYEGGSLIGGAQQSAHCYDLAVEYWTSQDIRRRYPALRVRNEEVALFERDAGYVVPEAAVAAHMELAVRSGAQARFGVSLKTWRHGGNGIDVELSSGESLRCGRLILTLGPWFKETLESLGVPIRVQRNVQVWFDSPAGFGADRVPAFLLQRGELPALLYGFPDTGDGVKAALHAYGTTVEHAALLDRSIAQTDTLQVKEAMEQWIPGCCERVRDAKACMYALTPDENFVVDRHPKYDDVVLCGGFSGHGFKFASVIGEIAATLALGGTPPYDLEFLSLAPRRLGT